MRLLLLLLEAAAAVRSHDKWGSLFTADSGKASRMTDAHLPPGMEV